MLSFSELEFEWSVHVIDVLNTTCYLYNYLIFLLCPMIYLYHGSEKCQKTSYHKFGYMHNEISIEMHSIIPMKLRI